MSIHLNYEHYQGFMKLFDLPLDNGDVYFEVSGDKPVTLKELCSIFEGLGYGMFSFAHAMPKLHEKIAFENFEERGERFIALKLAPFLGLPGNDHKVELNELKEFLQWVKDKAFENPNQNLRLILDSVDKEARFELSGPNQVLIAELNQQMNSKIKQSDILTQWVANQKEGIINTKGDLLDLFANFPASLLMSNEEKDKYHSLQPTQPTAKQLRKKLRYH